MKYNNNLTEAQVLSKTEPPNQTHITSADVIAYLLNFGAVSSTMDINRARIRKRTIQV